MYEMNTINAKITHECTNGNLEVSVNRFNSISKI